MQEMGSQALLSAIPSHAGHRVGNVFLLLFIFRGSEISLALNSDLFERWNMPTFQLLWSAVLQNATQCTLNQNLTVLWRLTLAILWVGRLDFLHCKPFQQHLCSEASTQSESQQGPAHKHTLQLGGWGEEQNGSGLEIHRTERSKSTLFYIRMKIIAYGLSKQSLCSKHELFNKTVHTLLCLFKKHSKWKWRQYFLITETDPQLCKRKSRKGKNMLRTSRLKSWQSTSQSVATSMTISITAPRTWLQISREDLSS